MNKIWDVVIAGGGLAGLVAAGEMALQGQDILFVEPSHVLAAECTRAKCPSRSLLDAQGSFLDEVRTQAARISGGSADLSLGFLLEMALEQAFLHVGGRILYGGRSIDATPHSDQKKVILEVAAKSGPLFFEASQGVLLNTKPPAGNKEWLHCVLLVGAQNSTDILGEFAGNGTSLRYRIVTTDAKSRTQAWITWQETSADSWEAEQVLARNLPPLIEHLRANHPELAPIEVIYLGDEPLAFAKGTLETTFQWFSSTSTQAREISLPMATPSSPLLQIDLIGGLLAKNGAALAASLHAELTSFTR